MAFFFTFHNCSNVLNLKMIEPYFSELYIPVGDMLKISFPHHNE